MASSPKLCASPAGRVRHNPYASPTTSTPQNSDLTPPNPIGTPMIRSLSTSFASVPPMTPPVNYAATAWPTPPATEHSKSMQLPAAAPYPQDIGEYHPAPVAMVAAPFVPMPYEAMDAAMAFLMYNNASAAAAQAAAAQQQQYQQQQQYVMYQQQPQQQQFHGYGNNEGYVMQQQQVQPQFMRQRRGTAAPNDDATGPSATIPTYEELESYAGTLAEQARTAAGSSFIQAAVKDSPDPRCLPFVWAELAPVLGDLLLDAHGCYVVKTLLDRLPAAEIGYVLQAITADEQLGFSICTHSLHTRRVVQHIIETIDGGFLCQLMSRHCNEVAMTQQGCIVMQRSMDHAPVGPARDALFEAIAINLVRFAKDPFANYVVQHLMEVGERVSTANAMWKSFQGHVVELACNKFASNVIEKCLFHCTAEVQHEILSEMYSIGHQGLYNMLQDSFGNYIIQSSIALATFRDVALIDERLRPVLAHTPYGHKIEARLDRRLKGKPVTARTPTGPAVPATAPAAAPAAAPAPQHQTRRGRGRGQHNLPEGEVPW